MLIYVIANHQCPSLSWQTRAEQLQPVTVSRGTLSGQRFKFETHNGKAKDNGREVELAVLLRDLLAHMELSALAMEGVNSCRYPRSRRYQNLGRHVLAA